MGFPRFITTKCCKCGKKFGIPETIWAAQIIQRGKKFICNDCRDKGKFESNYINTCDVEDLTMKEFDAVIGDVPRSAYVRRLMINEIKSLKQSTPQLQLQPRNQHEHEQK